MTKGSLKPNERTYIEILKSPESGKWYARDIEHQTIVGTVGCATAEEAARLATLPKYEPDKYS